jgi:hypothetical protein
MAQHDSPPDAQQHMQTQENQDTPAETTLLSRTTCDNFGDHYAWLVSLTRRADRRAMMNKMFGTEKPGVLDRDTEEEVLHFEGSAMVVSWCTHCQRHFSPCESMVAYTCRGHPLQAVRGRHACCGGGAGSPPCTPCTHLTRRDLATGRREIPLLLFIAGRLRWPSERVVRHVLYVKRDDVPYYDALGTVLCLNLYDRERDMEANVLM